MPLTLDPAILTEINKSNLAAIDLFEVDFGNNLKRYWSTRKVPSEFLFQDFTVSEFEPRVRSVGNRTWKLGPDDDSLTLVVADNVGDPSDTTRERLSDLTRMFGLDIFEGAQVRAHRLFPNIKKTFKNVWFGEGLAPTLEEDLYTWELEFGFGNFRQTFGRRLQATCPHIFAGGEGADCPYALERQIGVPEARLVFAAGAGTSNTTIIGSGFSGVVQAGWFVFNRTNNAYARVKSVDSDTQLTIENVAAGENGTATFASGNSLIVGPKFLACPKSVFACKERGMFGPWNVETRTNGVGDNRRYFGANSEAARVVFFGRTPKSAGRDRFSRERLGNESLDGSVVPVVVGHTRVRSRPSVFMAPAGNFQHGFFLLCEGEVYDVRAPFVNGKPIDDNPPDELDTLGEVIKNDSFIKWGTWVGNSNQAFEQLSGLEDSRGTNVELAKAVRRAVGRRRGFAMTSNFALDTYGTGAADGGNPFLFNDKEGDGVSFSGFVPVRIRIQTDQDVQGALSGDFDISGIMTRLPASMASNSEDSTKFDLQGIKYTRFANPIQFAWLIATDGRFGGGLSENRILESSVVSTSDFCEGLVTSTQSQSSEQTGTIKASSADVLGEPTIPFLFSDDLFAENNTLAGRRVVINPGTSRATVARVESNMLFDVGQEDLLRSFVPGVGRIKGGLLDASPRGTLILLDRGFPAGFEPSSGDSFTIQLVAGNLVKRFKANGAVADDTSVGEVLQSILDNCFGTFRTNLDKVEFLIRKKLTAAELDTIVTDGVFTDRGDSPNIIRDSSGKTTLKVVGRESVTEIPNEFSVEFPDRERNFQVSRVVVYNEAAQIRAAERLGEIGDRKVIRETIELNLTTSKDQAARLLTLHARQRFTENLFVEFQTSMKNGFRILPGDVIAIDSNTIAAHVDFGLLSEDVFSGNALFFRVLEKEEVDKFVITFRCQLHVNGIFDGFGDFGLFFTTPDIKLERNLLPLNVKPETPTEKNVVQADGTVRSFIGVKITYPGT